MSKEQIIERIEIIIMEAERRRKEPSGIFPIERSYGYLLGSIEGLVEIAKGK